MGYNKLLLKQSGVIVAKIVSSVPGTSCLFEGHLITDIQTYPELREAPIINGISQENLEPVAAFANKLGSSRASTQNWSTTSRL